MSVMAVHYSCRVRYSSRPFRSWELW